MNPVHQQVLILYRAAHALDEARFIITDAAQLAEIRQAADHVQRVLGQIVVAESKRKQGLAAQETSP